MSYFEIMKEAKEHEESVKAWYKENAVVGLTVVIEFCRSLNRDEITEIRKGRIYTKRHGSFYFNGKNCFHPKGQTKMLIPTLELIEKAWVNPKDKENKLC